jgi:hypothetical protein
MYTLRSVSSSSDIDTASVKRNTVSSVATSVDVGGIEKTGESLTGLTTISSFFVPDDTLSLSIIDTLIVSVPAKLSDGRYLSFAIAALI